MKLRSQTIRRKTAALMLAVLLINILFTGCGKTDKVTVSRSWDVTSVSGSAAEETAVSVTPAADDVTKEEPTPMPTAAEVTPADVAEEVPEDADFELNELNIAVDARFSPGNDKAIEKFEQQWEEAVSANLGHYIDLHITYHPQNTYVSDINALLENGEAGDGTYPDALVMSRSMFKAYSDAGYLWDLSEAYANAAFQSRMLKGDVNEALKDENGRLYGFMPTYGNGCITYVKASWFEIYARKTDGIDSIEDVDTFDEYYDMLKYFSEDNNSGVIAAGFLKDDEPYIDMLPEFWQDAYPEFYIDGDEWVDGFTQQATIDALDRIALAVEEGVIDADTKEADAKIARDKFTSAERSRTDMTLNYWAGEWMRSLTDKMDTNGVDTDLEDDRLLMLPPIKEITESRGGYLRREAPIWVITDDGNKGSRREQAIFDAFFETMLDGGEIQTIWTKNTKNVHWDYVIAPIENPNAKVDELVESSKVFFRTYSNEAPVTAVINTSDADRRKLINGRKELILKVAEGKMTGAEAVKEYKEKYGETSEAILKELNGE